MTTWTTATPTTTTWTRTLPSDGEVSYQFTSGSPYGLLLVITRPYTETIYEGSLFTEVEPTAAVWTLQEAS